MFLIKVLITTLLLSYASCQDLKLREIDDKVWWIMIFFGASLAIFESFSQNNFKIFLDSVSVGILMYVFAMILYYFNLFGGADGKALVGIGVMFPKVKGFLLPIFPISVFNNALILSLVIPIFLVFYNLFKKNDFEGIENQLIKKFICMFIGYKIDVSKVDDKVFPIEYVENGKKTLKLFQKLEYDVESYKKSHKGKVWVTAGLPFIVLITLGFFVAIFYCDLILKFVFLLL